MVKKAIFILFKMLFYQFSFFKIAFCIGDALSLLRDFRAKKKNLYNESDSLLVDSVLKRKNLIPSSGLV